MSKREPTTVKRAVERAFSEVAENYSTSVVHASGPEFIHMTEAANLQGDERVLDAGCGAGHTAIAFAPHVDEVIALDLSESMLNQVDRLAKDRRIDNITLHQGDVEEIVFPDGHFDLVVSRYSAHHWPNPRQALREIARILDAGGGGQLILADVVSFDAPAIDTFVQTMELLRDPSHVRDHTIAQWISMLSAAGFAAEVVFQWDVRLNFDAWVGRMATPSANVAVIRQLMDGASHDVRNAMKFEDDYTFSFQGAVLRGVRSR